MLSCGMPAWIMCVPERCLPSRKSEARLIPRAPLPQSKVPEAAPPVPSTFVLLLTDEDVMLGAPTLAGLHTVYAKLLRL